MDESQEGGSELVIAGGDAPELLQPVEETFDVVALSIDAFLPAEALLPVGFFGNVGDRTLGSNMRTNAIGIVALIGDHDRALVESFEQRLGGGRVMVVARRNQERDRTALRIDAGMDFRREPAPASAHTTISTLFFTPEAC